MLLHNLGNSLDFPVEGGIFLFQHLDHLGFLVNTLLSVGILCDMGWNDLAFVHCLKVN